MVIVGRSNNFALKINSIYPQDTGPAGNVAPTILLSRSFFSVVRMIALLLSVWISPVLSAQDISGGWSGTLLQDEGGFADRFELYFDVEQMGISMKGTAYVKLGELHAEMKISGFQSPDGNWRVTETEILRNNKAGFDVSWCLKEYDLRVEYRQGELVLTGPWWGFSEHGPCVPGSITLRKRVKVASHLIFLGGEYAIDIVPHGQIHHGDHPFDRGRT